MKLTHTYLIIILSITCAWSNNTYAQSISELAFNAIPPEAMQAIDTVNQSIENRGIPLFDNRALSAGIGALAGVFGYNMLYNTAINAAATNQLPMMTSAVIGALLADYLYRQNDSMPIFGLEFP